jgi:hypothetical protein
LESEVNEPAGRPLFRYRADPLFEILLGVRPADWAKTHGHAGAAPEVSVADHRQDRVSLARIQLPAFDQRDRFFQNGLLCLGRGKVSKIMRDGALERKHRDYEAVNDRSCH